MTLGRSKAAKQAKEITLHESHPAIKVKYYGNAPSEQAWDSAVESFWFQAQLIAHEHGYSGVFSEGRSGGWVVPYTQSIGTKVQKFTDWPGQGPEKGYPVYPDVTQANEKTQFIRFQRDILILFSETIENMLAEEN